MTLLDDLRTLLRRSGPSVAAPVAAPPELLSETYEALFCVLSRLEAAQSWFESAIETAHRRWTASGYLERFVGVVWAELSSGYGARLPQSERVRLALEVLETAVCEEAPKMESLVRRLEVKRVAARAQEAAEGRTSVDAKAYAEALGLRRSNGTVTAIGRLFLDLVGMEAVEWLLHLEVLRSTGMADPWRVSAEVVVRMLSLGRVAVPLYRGEEHELFPSDSTAERLDALGVLGQHVNPFEWGWALTPQGRRALAAVVSDPPTAMHQLAQAAISDEVGALLGTSPNTTSATTATFEFARLVSHELRNAVGPLRAALRPLVAAAAAQLESDEHERLSGRVERGLERLEKFADETTRLARHGGHGAAFSVADCLEDALRATAHERNGHLQVERSLVEVEVWGQRERLALAFANIIRNAAQAAPASGAVLRVHLSAVNGHAKVTFADDGPGVAEEDAARLFDAGFSRRGGTGMGLAFVRAVVEDELHGRVGYAPGERGGATFQLIIPCRARGVQ